MKKIGKTKLIQCSHMTRETLNDVSNSTK